MYDTLFSEILTYIVYMDLLVTCFLCIWSCLFSFTSDEDEEDRDALLYLPVSPDIEEPEESAWTIPTEVSPHCSVLMPLVFCSTSLL